jgi:hypothetical protein
MSPPVTRLLLLTSVCALAGSLVSCETETYSPDGNIFLRSSPRYGHGGTERPKYKYGATGERPGEQPAKPKRETEYISGSEDDRSRSGDRSDGSDGGSETGETAGGPASTDDRDDGGAESTASTEPAPETKPKPDTEDLPYATPVVGKDGFVYSPYYSAGYVDVSGMPSGSKARCPYTKKIFRVP